MSTVTAQPPNFTLTPDPSQTQQSQPQGPTTGPIYLYAFTLIAFLICAFACCSAWRGVVIRRRRREMGLAELAEWGMGGHDAFGNRMKVEALPDPPVMYEVYLEDGKAEGGRWYWGQEKGMMDDGIWSNKMPISTSVVPVSDQPPQAEADPTLGITTLSALNELLPHRWGFVQRLRTRRQKSPSSASSPLSVDAPPPPPSPRKAVTSVLIAMPAPHHTHDERRSSAALSEGTLVFEDEFPEVVFGVYESAWAQPAPASLAATPNNDAASRV
ncbi:hypothetical protein FRC04_000949 [Tulasnella sp. 424]|nr:hypothetical protein FRC04_000949 [Tulasnella sp. 424]KAG8977863.1 hypothetical protein FRC05_000391 [Tulasnella sp. 425]